jgi:prepilin-type N-terminal cleavage/methylation domain-containing protein
MKRRNGFTLVEMLVAMALIIFIMAILSQAFVSATTTFRNLKALGDLTNKLRSVTTLLQRDLAADHFDGKKRLSNPNFWVNGPPSQGFFRVWQGSPPSNVWGAPYYVENLAPPNPPTSITDLDGFHSFRSVDHMLAFSVKLRGDQMGDFLTAGPQGGGTQLGAIPSFGPAEARYQSANTYNYQWAEAAWFLQPQIDPNTLVQDSTFPDATTGTPAIPLYTLYRSQRLAVPDNNLVPTQTTATIPQSQLLEVSCWPNGTNWYFNSPMDLTVPSRRFGMVPGNLAGMLPLSSSLGVPPPPLYDYPTLSQLGGPSGPLANADLQLTDVVSFDVRLLVAGISGNPEPFVPVYKIAQSYNNGNPAFNPATGPVVFDTWSSLNDALTGYPGYSSWNVPGQATSIPLWNAALQAGPIVQAIQITIRIWDPKTYQTREVTIVQAM